MLPITTRPMPLPKLNGNHRDKQKDAQQLALVTFLIDAKKQSYIRFKQRVFMFFNLGLLISIGLVIALFEWKSYDKPHEVEIVKSTDISEEVLDIPITSQPPPPPVKPVQPNIIEVTEEEVLEEIEVDFDVEVTEKQVVKDVTVEEIPEAPAEPFEEEVAEEIFLIVEEQPVPVGGMASFLQFVAENIRYPAPARRLGIEGKVFVEFIVNTDGSLTDMKVVKGIGGGCDEEALRVLEAAPKWKPGKQRGKPVRVKMVFPIHFVLR